MVTAAGGTPVPLKLPDSGHAWDDLLLGTDGVLFLGQAKPTPRQLANEERLCRWCRDREVPFLGVDKGLHALALAFGGTLHTDLPRELPNALQHRHPPEPGVRHAITVEAGTRLAQLYCEGEIVVNSEHHHAINKVPRGFRWEKHEKIVTAQADAERSLNGRGRVLLRPSGTEPVLRVMVEGEPKEAIESAAHSIAAAVRSAAGA